MFNDERSLMMIKLNLYLLHQIEHIFQIHLQSPFILGILIFPFPPRQKILVWSDYNKQLAGQFIRMCLKIEKRCQFVLEKIFNVKMHVFFVFFISRLKMHARCVSWARVWVWGENYLGTSPAVWEHRYLSYESGAGVWSEGSLGFWVMVKNLSHRFCLDWTTMS